MGVGWPEGTPLRKASYFAYNHFPANQFLRSTYKAGPLVLVILAALAGLGADAEGTAPEAFKNYFRADVEKWAKVVKAAKVSAE